MGGDPDAGLGDSLVVADGAAAQDAVTPGDDTPAGTDSLTVADGALTDSGEVDAAPADALLADGLVDAGVDGLTPEDISLSTSTCTQIGQCAQNECNANKPLCGLGCSNGASGADAQKASNLLNCITGTCMAKVCARKVSAACMDPCVVTFCGNEMATCFATGENGPSGCNTIFGCFDACDKLGTNVFTCQSACYNGLTPAGKTQLAAFLACAKSKNTTQEALGLCSPELLACTADGATGSGSCYDLATCAALCPPSNTVCGATCYASATSAAQKEYLSLGACLSANGGNLTTCLPATQACANPSGTGKCATVLTCISDCQKALGTTDDKGYCALSCLHGLSQASATAAVGVISCPTAKCPGCLTGDPACQSCATAQCGGELLGCALN